MLRECNNQAKKLWIGLWGICNSYDYIYTKYSSKSVDNHFFILFS